MILREPEDLVAVVKDMDWLIETPTIIEDPVLNQVRLDVRTPRETLGPKKARLRVLPFRLTMPYSIGRKRDEYLVTPARHNGFENENSLLQAVGREEGPYRQIRQMSEAAARELTLRFLKSRFGLKDGIVTIEEVTTQVYDAAKRGLNRQQLNAFRSRGEITLRSPLTGWARLAEVPELLNRLYEYLLLERGQPYGNVDSPRRLLEPHPDARR